MTKNIEQTIEELKQKLAQAEEIKRKEEQRVIWVIGQTIIKELRKDKVLRLAIFNLLDQNIKNERDKEKINRIFSEMEGNKNEESSPSNTTTSNNSRM